MGIPKIKLEKADAERYWQEAESFFEAVGLVLVMAAQDGDLARLIYLWTCFYRLFSEAYKEMVGINMTEH